MNLTELLLQELLRHLMLDTISSISIIARDNRAMLYFTDCIETIELLPDGAIHCNRDYDTLGEVYNYRFPDITKWLKSFDMTKKELEPFEV